MILREVTFFTSWGRYFEGIVTCLCYEHTLLFFIITIHARILSISCIETIFNLSYASFSWQIIFVYICSILVCGAFSTMYLFFHFKCQKWLYSLSLFSHSLKGWVKGAHTILHYANGANIYGNRMVLMVHIKL